MVRSILLVGASRGLGLGLAQRHLERGWTVVATVRTTSAPLLALGPDKLRVETLDMTDQNALSRLADQLGDTRFERVFVNAGIGGDPNRNAATLSDADFSALMLCNALAPMRVLERFSANVPAGGILAAMSSGLGSVHNNTRGGFESYRASKAALNTLLRSAATRDGGRHLFLAVDPGWVRTDMGGAQAPLDVGTSTTGIADMLDARAAAQAGATASTSAFVSYQNRDVPW